MAVLNQTLHRKNSGGTYDTIYLTANMANVTGVLPVANGGTGMDSGLGVTDAFDVSTASGVDFESMSGVDMSTITGVDFEAMGGADLSIITGIDFESMSGVSIEPVTLVDISELIH